MTSPKPPPGHFQLLYFAAASSYTKKSSDVFKAPVPASELFAVLEKAYPGIKENVLGSCAVTVNLQYIDIEEDPDLSIREGDEVAIIPPVSSG